MAACPALQLLLRGALELVVVQPRATSSEGKHPDQMIQFLNPPLMWQSLATPKETALSSLCIYCLVALVTTQNHEHCKRFEHT